MVDGRLHYMLARKQFPHLSPTQIRRINGLMDNRQAQFLAFPQFDTLGIGKGHRKAKHDALSAAMIGAHVAGQEGMQAAMFHTMLDSMSTQIERIYGAEKRDIIMSLWKMNMMNRRW